jgi:tRNA(fMet)-specific endonuclease VapC
MSDVVLLDTTVASLLHPRREPSAGRALYEPHMRGRILALSFQSVAELWAWAERNRWGARSREGLDAFIRRFLVVRYTYELAKVWARVMAASREEGRRFEAGDCWIAATAVHRGLTLLAHDTDFEGRAIEGLKVVCYVGSAGSAGR